MPLPWIIAPLGIYGCVWMAKGLPAVTWIRFLIWLCIGLAIYFVYGLRKSQLAGIADGPLTVNHGADRRSFYLRGLWVSSSCLVFMEVLALAFAKSLEGRFGFGGILSSRLIGSPGGADALSPLSQRIQSAVIELEVILVIYLGLFLLLWITSRRKHACSPA
jgi:hypothetical protein